MDRLRVVVGAVTADSQPSVKLRHLADQLDGESIEPWPMRPADVADELRAIADQLEAVDVHRVTLDGVLTLYLTDGPVTVANAQLILEERAGAL